METIKAKAFTVEGIEALFGVKNFSISDVKWRLPDIFLEYPHYLENAIGFSICTKGYAVIKINFQEFFVSPNSIVTIFPNRIIEPIDISGDFTTESLYFTFDFVSDLPLVSNFSILDKIENTPCIDVPSSEASNILKYHSFIVEQYNRKDHPYRQEITKSLLFALITEIGALYLTSEQIKNANTHAEYLVKHFYRLLKNHHKEERRISFYADKLCLSPKYLTTILKKTTGKSVHEWINDAVIVSAKILLKTTAFTITEISDDLNFADASLFCRFFKQHTKMTPLQYRESGTKVREITE
ncbi:MAG TPA: AraC family transcriptional regulator [Porphyromonadaceae bacterium]|jgi:AraC-like DNA-binding protein|uniref:helix-turn-helix domain-containing protein n=1 Tax=Limibacterium fermenti TaxID=3229863 RepID=UPI000E92536F|nr:AraC family transcriptional regulator [Porphyromonadaceae bacterium]HBL34957.1 AraC family transcriptional regulator [Porphyromonadaceae bacterium]HBX45321.1 AraC family transcriptional regulator [Porphyromonadaceae bacterium]